MSEPVNQDPGVMTSPGQQGMSGIFKAVEALKHTPVAPVAPETPAKAAPVVPETPALESKPSAHSPLDMLQSTEVKPEVSSDDPELTEFEKTLPEADAGMKEPARKGWDALKDSAKRAKKEALEAKKERERLQVEYDEFKKKVPEPTVPEDYQKYKQEATELKQKNAIWALETDEKFKKGVLEPLQTAEYALGGLMQTYKIDATTLEKAFGEKDRSARNRAFAEIITGSEMNPLDVEDFKSAIQTIQDLHFKREEGYQNATKLNEASEARTKEENQKKQRATQREIDDQDNSIFDKLSKNAEVVKDILKDTTFANDVRSKVKDFLSKEQPLEMKVFSAYASYLVPKLRDEIKAVKAELAKTKASLSERTKSDAPIGGGGTPISKPAPEKPYKPGEAIGVAMADYERSRGR